MPTDAVVAEVWMPVNVPLPSCPTTSLDAPVLEVLSMTQAVPVQDAPPLVVLPINTPPPTIATPLLPLSQSMRPDKLPNNPDAPVSGATLKSTIRLPELKVLRTRICTAELAAFSTCNGDTGLTVPIPSL